jgi:16S rRNA (guanine527-N7)-methyltransferase
VNLCGELQQGCEQLGIALNEEAQRLLLEYITLLQKWNMVYNLTAIRDPQQMVSNHLLDSLAVMPYLWPGRWLDVGCGAGLPGVVLAVVQPEWQFVLIDSNSKKTSFVQQVLIELGLCNVVVYCSRVEQWNTTERFDGIISRAFSGLGEFIQRTRHLMDEQGRWVAMKGIAERDLMSVPEGCKVERVIELHVPSLSAARSLIIGACKGKATT